ncbi:MAG: TRAP transporter small permease [Burkholderiales bacterium]|nr:TRAP transporter small permease [Burkholderiales bacterium]
MKNNLLAMEAAVVRVEEAVVFAVLALLVVTLGLQVLSRFVLEFPLAWTEELARVGQIWLVFFGAAVGARRAEHFVVELFMERVAFPGKRMVARTIDVIVVAFFCALAVMAAQAAIEGAGQELPTLGISIAWAYTAIPIGCLLMAFHFGLAWIRPLEARAAGEGVAE